MDDSGATGQDAGRAGDGADRHDTGRNETRTERYDRNWHDIQQELRITQTGTQLLAGFLLTLPFQQRFQQLTDAQIGSYLFLVVLAAAVSILALAPVSTHRLLFRRRQMEELVTSSNRILIICLVASSILFAGTVFLIFDVVLGQQFGIVTGAILLLATAGLWVGIPLRLRSRR
jgi:heme exporter protein D